MKVFDKSFLIIRILAIIVFFILASGATYFIIINLNNNADNPFCASWNKEEVDDYIRSKGIVSFNSQINCNTYYLELENYSVNQLTNVASDYHFDLAVEFIIVNDNEIIFGQFQEGEVVYNVNNKN